MSNSHNQKKTPACSTLGKRVDMVEVELNLLVFVLATGRHVIT